MDYNKVLLFLHLKHFSILILFLQFVSCSSKLVAQIDEPKFIKYSVDQGFPARSAKKVIQDKDGFIWIGTQHEGLYRFDGHHFKAFLNDSTNENSLPSNEILYLTIDAKDRMWVGTVRGFAMYRPEKEDFKVYWHEEDDKKTGKNSYVSALYPDSNGNLWIGCWFGLGFFEVDRKIYLLSLYK